MDQGVNYVKVSLTQGKFCIIDIVDLDKISNHKWYVIKSKSKNSERLYAYGLVNNQYILMHRFIMGLQSGDCRQIDHKNHDGLDNRRKNLRICTPRQNQLNRRQLRIFSSQYTGVAWSNKYQLWSSHYDKRFLGYFNNEKTAAKVRDAYAILDSPDFIITNFDKRLYTPDRVRKIIRANKDRRIKKRKSILKYRGVRCFTHRNLKKPWQTFYKQHIGYFNTAKTAAHVYDAYLLHNNPNALVTNFDKSKYTAYRINKIIRGVEKRQKIK